MSLVMDDFYHAHAHAHSLRLLCVESSGDLVANSQAGDYVLTRNGKTEETRNGDVTRTITGNVTESISGGAVEIKNELDGKTVTEMMPDGDYKTEITAMNYETMFMVNGEHKVMDMSNKKTVYDLAITDLTFSNPRSTTDVNVVFETFAGVKNSNHLAVSGGIYVGARADLYVGPKIVDKKIYIRKSATSLDQGEAFLTDRKIGKLGYKLTIIG